jgi:hypothetical protein
LVMPSLRGSSRHVASGSGSGSGSGSMIRMRTTPVACLAGTVPLLGNSCGGGPLKGNTCDYGGKTYGDGASFPSTDGCNTCSCSGGSVQCTLRACVAGKWFATCGDPVCRTDRDAGASTCTTEKIGDPCSNVGASCDPADECNTRIVCATSDPRASGCPVSRARHKTDITYLDEAQREEQRRSLMELRLATYRYKAAGPTGPRQLGFIIDDAPAIPAVNPDGESVNLYGFTSMAVATLQAQQAEIARLREELSSLRREIKQRRR